MAALGSLVRQLFAYQDCNVLSTLEAIVQAGLAYCLALYVIGAIADSKN